MLELQLDETYKLTSDKLNWILEKYEEVIDLKSKQPTGEFKYKTVGFFGLNISHALKRYVTETLRSEDNTDAHKLIDKLNELNLNIDKVVKKENIKLVVKDDE